MQSNCLQRYELAVNPTEIMQHPALKSASYVDADYEHFPGPIFGLASHTIK